MTNLAYVKSCLNYTGGKYRLLRQMMPLFPKNIRHFTDLFCGGANVAVNAPANGIIRCVDKEQQVIRLFQTLQRTPYEKVFEIIHHIIETYRLSDTKKYGYTTYGCESSEGLATYNKEPYLTLRKDYNNRTEDNTYYDLMFYLLTVYGFNNQIRFNKQGHFNIPVGKRDFNEQVQANLRAFMRLLKEKEIEFLCADFREVDLNLAPGDFLYADPPYFISTATYNEHGGWTEQEEKDLLQLLDSLHEKGVSFALSNVLEHKGKENTMLKKWAEKYHIHYLDFHYHNANYQRKKKDTKTVEVLITNDINRQ